jgi:hypothetical protein
MKRWALPALLCAACSASERPSAVSATVPWGRAVPACVPGRQEPCACAGGTLGVQQCLPTRVFARCECAEAAALAVTPPPYQAGDPTPCAGSPNAFYVDGAPGELLHPGGELFLGALSVDASPSRVTVNAQPEGRGEWRLSFGTPKGQPLGVGQYPAVSDRGHDPFFLWAPDSVCEQPKARFRIDALDAAQGSLRFAAVFEVYCGHSSAALRGCVRYEGAAP